MLFFLPFERLTIKTYLSPEKIQQKLAEVVEPRRMRFGFLSGPHKPYQGELDGKRFNITRIIHYRNSFLPVIKGEIRPEIEGCSIDITMYPHPVVIAFMIFWLGTTGSIFFALLCNALLSVVLSGTGDIASSSSGIFIPGLMFIFGYLLLTGGFKFESVRSKVFLQKLFGAAL